MEKKPLRRVQLIFPGTQVWTGPPRHAGVEGEAEVGCDLNERLELAVSSPQPSVVEIGELRTRLSSASRHFEL